MSIELRRVCKRYGRGLDALRDVDLTVGDRELVVILGPTGCGKTTLLRLLAGLEVPTAGEIVIDGRAAEAIPPRDRGIAMVFQDPPLQPHLRVLDEIAFGLRARGERKAAARERARDVAERLGIGHLIERRPAFLSGGERRRVALGRALAQSPRHLLLDEPLASLDPPERARLADEIRRAHDSLPGGTILVTHEHDEALALGDRVVVLAAGEIRQVGSPREVHDFPRDLFVGRFLGTPPLNVIGARARAMGDHVAIETAFGTILYDRPELPRERELPDMDGLRLGIRPRAIIIGSDPALDGALRGELRGRIVRAEWHPEGRLLSVEPVSDDDLPRGAPSPDARAGSDLVPPTLRAIAVAGSNGQAADAGAEIRFRLAPGGVHLFDEAGTNLRSAD